MLSRALRRLCLPALVSLVAVHHFTKIIRPFASIRPSRMVTASEENLKKVGAILNDPKRPLKERFRALFTLKNLGGIKYISECFKDPSALLKHELAYCLGQTQNPEAIPILLDVLKDVKMEPIARHEAGEALGAIGCPEALSSLEKYSNDPNPVIAETCQLALKRIDFVKTDEYKKLDLSAVPYKSVDPTPPYAKGSRSVEELQEILCDAKQPLWDRYRAMFSLRNLGSNEAVGALGKALSCPSSALFRHEVAYVFGQMQHEASIPYLSTCLENTKELGMVRHECAEALGSIATKECMVLLEKYLNDPEDIVRESCEVALDMCEYENSTELQYADTLQKVAAVHNNCRGAVYPRCGVKRAEVQPEKVPWSVSWPQYQPVFHESESIDQKPWADPKIFTENFNPKYNDVDGNVNRKSHEEDYQIVDNLPRNPHGRTGITGRGVLGRYGPNHAADPVVTRWKRDSSGTRVMDDTGKLPVLEFVAIERRDNAEWAIPGGMVDPGETVSTTLMREFMEEALNSDKEAGDGEEGRKIVETFFAKGGVEIYKGYVDDPRNTDNAWMETVVYNFHDEKGETVGKFKLEAGSDAGKVRWMTLSKGVKLYADHAKFLESVANRLKAHW